MIEKLKFIIYNDEKFQNKAGYEISVQINPEDFTEKKSVSYSDRKNSEPQYEGTENETISLKFTIDGTGVVASGAENPVNVSDKVNELEKYLYLPQKSDDTKPALPYFVLISWGKLFFKGRLQEMDVHYTLFKANGEPLRAVVSLTFVRARLENSETNAPEGQTTPEEKDKVVTVKCGESLPSLCRREYGDSSMVEQIAERNKLPSIRGVQAGDRLVFPKQ